MRPILFFLMLLSGMVGAVAQDTALDSAKVLVASNRTRDAIPVLERLMAADPTKAAHNYFLGLCLVREGIRIPEATAYLEKAAGLYAAMDFNPGMGEPELVHYYLAMAHARQQDCERAMMHYRELVEVYSGNDPFYPNEAMKWVVLCNEPQRMAQETVGTAASPGPRPLMRDRLVAVTAPSSKKDTVVTRPMQFTTGSVLYGVQVGALLRPTYTVHFPGLRNVGVYVDENGIYRYVIGNLTYRSQAEKLLGEVRAAGYPDAFIVDINDPQRYRDEVVLLNEVGIQRQLTGEVEFRVQIGAFSEVLPERLAQLYLQVEGLKELRAGDLTVLMAGSFKTYWEAQTERDRLVESGFPDAFITALNQGQRVPVDIAVRHLENMRQGMPKGAAKRRRD